MHYHSHRTALKCFKITRILMRLRPTNVKPDSVASYRQRETTPEVSTPCTRLRMEFLILENSSCDFLVCLVNFWAMNSASRWSLPSSSVTPNNLSSSKIPNFHDVMQQAMTVALKIRISTTVRETICKWCKTDRISVREPTQFCLIIFWHHCMAGSWSESCYSDTYTL